MLFLVRQGWCFSFWKITFFLIEKAKYFGFFYSEFFLEISTISHEKVKKQTSRMLKAI